MPSSFRFKSPFGHRDRTPSAVQLSFWMRAGSHLRTRFTLGLVLLVPILFTYFILGIFFDFLDGFLSPIFHQYELYFPGLGLVALLAIVYVSGLVASNLVGRMIFGALQRVLLRIPVVRTVYSLGKQLTDVFSGNQAPTGLNRVVMTEYLRPGSWAIGFLTGFTIAEDDTLFAILYIPTAPLPNSGWMTLVPAGSVYDINVTPNMAMQMVFSAGLVYPPAITRKPLPEAVDGLKVPQPEIAKTRS